MSTPPTQSSATQPSIAGDTRLLGIAPYLFVRDVRASAAFYRDKLGFAEHRFWGDPPSLCMAKRDGLMIMLSQADDPAKVRPNDGDGAAWDAYVWASDVEAVFRELRSHGVQVVYEPSVTLYDVKEFAVADPDGYVLAFGQDWTGKGATG